MVRRKGRCGTWCANLCFISNNIKIESTQKNPYAHANSPEADGRAAHVPASKHQQSAGCWPKCARVWHTTLPFAILPFSVKSFKEKKGGLNTAATDGYRYTNGVVLHPASNINRCRKYASHYASCVQRARGCV